VQQAVDGSAATTLVLCAGLYPGGVKIDRNLTLIGAGDGVAPAPHTVLDGDGTERVVTIDPGTTVTLRHLRITGGNTIFGGGGIFNNGDVLNIDECTVSGNTAGVGGGIDNQAGVLTLTNSDVSENEANAGGGINIEHGTVTLTECTVRENGAGVGGGIANVDGVLTLTSCIVAGNTADDTVGGGVYNVSGLILHDSTITLNHADDSGGGIYNDGMVDCSDNNTLAVNTAGNPPLPSNCVDGPGGSGCDCQL
jgi:hypothetical protein